MFRFFRKRTTATQSTAKKLSFGDYEDVIGDPNADDVNLVTNVPSFGNTGEMNWGYRGGGPLTLAFNVLYLYTEGDRMFCHRNMNDFREDFLLDTPQDQPLRISANNIIGWINARKGLMNA